VLQAQSFGLWAFSPWKLLAEIPRTLAVTFVMVRLLTMLGGNDRKSAAKPALLLWFGFPALMCPGAVTCEQSQWQVAAIHSGDWLLKTVLIADIVCGGQGGWHEHNESAQTKAHVR
jgi:hypothetical protein